MKIKEKMRKTLTLGILLMLLTVIFFAAPPMTENARAATAPTPDLSGLTQAHYWSCNNSTPTDTQVTIGSSTYNVSAGLYTNRSYVTDASGNTYLKGLLKRITPGTNGEEKITFNLNYNPGVKTISGKIKIPEQHGYYGENNFGKFVVSVGSAGYVMIYFNLAPGGNDTLLINNGSASTQYEIPRIPRDTWTDFIISVDAGTVLKTYIYFGGLSVERSIPIGSTSMTYFNSKIACTDAKLNFSFYLDEVYWYNEYYSLSNYYPEEDTTNTYYKGWDWNDYVYVAERVGWNQTSSSDLDINNSIHYYNFFDYYANFTMNKAVAILNPDGLYDMTVDQVINRTLNLTGLNGVYFRTPYNIDSGCPYAKKISWNAKNNPKGSKILGISTIDASTVNNWTIYTRIRENATAYAPLKVYPDVYFYDFGIVPWSSLDGAWIASLSGEDYALLNQTIETARSYLGTEKDLGVFLYTHLYYGLSAGAAPLPFEKKMFDYMYPELRYGNLSYAISLGPARFCNYADHAEINEWYSKQMAVAYSSDGKTITVYDQEDGTNVDIKSLHLPLYASESTGKITVVSHMNAQLEVEIPSTWTQNNIYVRDKTSGHLVDWTPGSVIFNATSHTYEIYDVIQETNEQVNDVLNLMLPLMMMLMIFSVVLAMAGGMSKASKNMFK